MQPLPTPTTLAPTRPLELVGQQVNFHVGLLVDFIVTGAQLSGRIVAVPGALLQDQNGTPLPVAVSRRWWSSPMSRSTQAASWSVMPRGAGSTAIR